MVRLYRLRFHRIYSSLVAGEEATGSMAEPRVEPEPFDQTEFRRDVRPNSERTDLPGCTLVGSNQAAATEDSFVSVISMNPATIRICTP